MVVCITQDTVLRQQMEPHFVAQLEDLGYHTISEVAEFGPKGLSKLSEAATYTTLYNKGVDAVLLAVLLDPSKEKINAVVKDKNNVSTFYYQRMRSYYKMQATEGYKKGDRKSSNLYWESLFYDLNSFEPLYSVQTRAFNATSAEAFASYFSDAIVKSMVRNKILTKHNNTAMTPIRSF